MPQAKIPQVADDGSIQWQSYTFGQLLDALRLNLPLDDSTTGPASFQEALRNSPLPYGVIQYDTVNLTAPLAYALGQNATAVYTLGGMQAKNQGGTRGWELVLPLTGWYRFSYQGRFDLGSATYNLAEGMRNGTALSGLGYSISGVNTVPYHNHVIDSFVIGTAGDAHNVVVGDGIGGTISVVGSSNGIPNEMQFQYLGPAGTKNL